MRAFVLFLLFLAVLLQGFLFLSRFNQQKVLTTPVEAPVRAPVLPPEEKVAPNPERGIEILRGVVRDAGGRPASNATITVTEIKPEEFTAFRVPRKSDVWRATTDADGAFALDTLPPGDFVVQALSGNAGALALVKLEARGPAGELMLRVEPGRVVSGQVRDEAGQVLEGVRVFVLETAAGTSALAPCRFLPATTNADGQFRIEYVPNIAAAFLAVSPDYAPQLVRDESQPKAEPLSFRLGAGVRLAGYLVEADSGQQADKTAVLVTEKEFGIERYRKHTTADASFLFQNLRAGTYEIALESSRYALESWPLVAEVQAESGNLDVRVVRAGRIRGRVLQEDKETGVDDIAVTLNSADGAVVGVERTASRGHYTFDGLTPGSYTLSVSEAQGDVSVEGETQITVESGKAARGPNFTLVQGVGISGKVLDAQGRPAPGANVFVSFSGGVQPDRSTRSGGDGSFQILGIPADSSVRVWAAHLGQASAALGPEKVGAEGLAELNFTLSLDATGSIAGIVLDALGQPAPGSLVHCAPPDPSLAAPLSQTTDATGHFQFDHLIPGEHRLIGGRDPQYMVETSSVAVSLGAGQQARDVKIVIP